MCIAVHFFACCVFQFEFTVYTSVHASDISVWYQFPQYIVITAGEVLFAVTGLSFAYSQVTYHKILLISYFYKISYICFSCILNFLT